MTDLEPRTDVTNLPVLDDAGTALIMRTVQQMESAHKIATALANTTFVPYQWRGKPDDVAAAILYGAAIGLDPMSALRGLYVVNGNPGMYARQMAALVMSRGHRVRTVEVSDTSATVEGQRRDSDDVETDTWTIERAKQAGYVPEIDPKTGKYRTNDKGKMLGNEKYLTEPQSMLYARALGTVCRRIAPDALAGLDYTVEELHVIKAESEVVRDQAPKRESATAVLGTQTPAREALVKCDGNHAMPQCGAANCWHGEPPEETAGEPARDESDSRTYEQGDAVQPASPAHLRKIGILFSTAGITDRAAALRVVGGIVGREVGSRKDLTDTEASALIDNLETLQRRGDLTDDADALLAAVATARQEAEQDEQAATELAAEGGA